jgi:hypothetical protein
MFIMIKRLSPDVTIDDLDQYIRPVLKGKLFQRSADLQSIRIVALIDKQGQIIERHGLFRITPDKLKPRVIKSLSDKFLALEMKTVNQFVARNWHNDRRMRAIEVELLPNERRIHDRRRAGLRTYTLVEKLYS